MTGKSLALILEAASKMDEEAVRRMLDDAPDLPNLYRRLRRLCNLLGQILRVGRFERSIPRRYRNKREAAECLLDHLLLLERLTTASTLDVAAIARTSTRPDPESTPEFPN